MSPVHPAADPSSSTTRVGWFPGLRGARLAIVACVAFFVAIPAPGAAFAATDQVKLALTPVGIRGSFFDLTMRPGETRSLQVDVGNAGGAPIAARTYAADVYTIINGGFGGRLRDEPQTGTTRWLDYATGVLELPVGMAVRRSFNVTVPADAGPGEYITSLVLENDQPIRSDGSVALDQVVRQAVAVVVTVPGRRSPALAIGEASHRVVNGLSVVSIAVENTGNVRLKPVITFTLADAAGRQVSHTSAPMDTFYAHTATLVEVPLAALLVAGTYTVTLTLEDAAQGSRAEKSALSFIVEAPAATAVSPGTAAGLTEVTQDVQAGPVSIPVWSLAIVAGLGLGLAGAWLILNLRRRRRTSTSP